MRKKNLSHNSLVLVEKTDLNRWLGGQKAKDRKTRITHSLMVFVVVFKQAFPGMWKTYFRGMSTDTKCPQ